jgi:hypothetical protein
VYLRLARRWVVVRRVPETNRARRLLQMPEGEVSMKKKLTLSKETLRTLDEKDLSLVVGGAGDSGSHEPPHGGPNSCPNTKDPGCS